MLLCDISQKFFVKNVIQYVSYYIHTVTLFTCVCFGVYIQGGLSALMMCCENGNSEMAKLLLDSEATPDLQQSVEYHKHSL